MTNQQKETIVAAIGKAADAMEAQEAALVTGDVEEFERQGAEYNRYCGLFSQAIGISKEQFDSLVWDFRNHQSLSE